MELTAPTLSSLTTLTGLALFTNLVMEVVKRVWRPTEENLDRFGPLLAIFIGIVAGIVAGIVINQLNVQGLIESALMGFFAGCVSVGFYDTVASQT